MRVTLRPDRGQTVYWNGRDPDKGWTLHFPQFNPVTKNLKTPSTGEILRLFSKTVKEIFFMCFEVLKSDTTQPPTLRDRVGESPEVPEPPFLRFTQVEALVKVGTVEHTGTRTTAGETLTSGIDVLWLLFWVVGEWLGSSGIPIVK